LGLTNISSSSWIEINRLDLLHNLSKIKKKINPKTKLSIVVKSNAYGHGLSTIVPFCQIEPSINSICVFNVLEGLESRKLGFTRDILVLGFYDYNLDKISKAISLNIDFAVYNYSQFKLLNGLAKNISKKVNIHIKVNTGLNRFGFSCSDILNLFKNNKLKMFNNLNIKALFSHFSESENKDQSFTDFQILSLNKLIFDLNKINIKFDLIHIANSMGTLVAGQKTHFNMVRTGGAFYGLSKVDSLNLRFALTWKTKILEIKTLPKDTPVGYNRSFVTKKSTKIALIPIGYSDGFSKNFSNQGQVLVNNKLAPVIGKVAMNVTTLDITDIDNVNIDTEVILLGNKPGVKVSDWLKYGNIYLYEAVIGLNSNITRILI